MLFDTPRQVPAVCGSVQTDFLLFLRIIIKHETIHNLVSVVFNAFRIRFLNGLRLSHIRILFATTQNENPVSFWLEEWRRLSIAAQPITQ